MLARLEIRRLGPGDGDVLAQLAREDAAFDLADRGAPRAPLETDAADAYLADPRVLHWVAEDAGAVDGHLLCHVQRRHAGPPQEVLQFYEACGFTRDDEQPTQMSRAI